MWRGMRMTFAAAVAAGAVGLGAALGGTHASAKVEAMKVELAWQADTKAFALTLAVGPSGDGLDVGGTVEDEATRDHVLKLARQACYLPIRDRIDVVTAHCADPALRDAAKAAVSQKLGARATAVRAGVVEPGAVLLTGSVTTIEDRLEAGRCLRGVPGCTRVENRLEVTNGKIVAVRADVPAEPSTKVVTQTPGLSLPTAPMPELPATPPVAYVRIQVRREPLEPGPRPVVKPAPSGYATPEGLPGYPGGEAQPSAARVDPPPTLFTAVRELVRPQARRVQTAPEPPMAMPVSVPTTVVTVPAAPPSKWPPAHAAASVEPTIAPVAAKVVVPPPAATPAKAATDPEQMRRLIAAGCGKLVTEVTLGRKPDGSPTYHVHAPAKHEQEVVEKLLTIPQVVASNAHIQIHLIP